jgi:hypothetical protein
MAPILLLDDVYRQRGRNKNQQTGNSDTMGARFVREGMMKKLATVVVMGVLGVGVGFGQAAPATMTDSQMMQAMLVEMRGIHNDLRLGQTTEILLTEMMVQRGVVDKATEKRDAARNRLSQLQQNEKNFAMQIAQNDEAVKTMLDPVQQKRMADQQQMMKQNLANFKSQEQDAVTAQQDAESTLRREQDMLTGIQDQLSDVVKKLQPVEK